MTNLKFTFLVIIACIFMSCDIITDSEEFTLIVLPDTQIYSYDKPDFRQCSRKEIFEQQTKWIADNAKKENIKFVLHVGDIVQLENELYQWENANKSMSTLDGIVPYCFAVGNHDLVNDSTRNTTNFNNTFPYSRYKSEKWYGGRMLNDGFTPKDNYDNSYHFFSGGGMDFMIVSLECGPTDDMIAWANDIIIENSDKRVIVITHSYMLGNNTRDKTTDYLPPSPPANSGEMLWQKLISKHANIFLVLSGHHENSVEHMGLLKSKGIHGNIVNQLLCGDWFDGWLRILNFVPDENKIVVKTYSPWQPESPSDQWRKYNFALPNHHLDRFHEYEISYDQHD